MALTHCPNGHYWDPDKDPSCPVCAGSGTTVPLDNSLAEQTLADPIGKTVPVGGAAIPPTMPVQHSAELQDDEKTVPAYQINGEFGKIDPVVGWLVCISGPEKGKDYRLHGGYNYIGRDARMDVSIRGDDLISREANAWIGYDDLSHTFIFGAGNSKNFVYLNDKPMPMGQSGAMKQHDVIRVGETQLMFFPLCTMDCNWKNGGLNR